MHVEQSEAARPEVLGGAPMLPKLAGGLLELLRDRPSSKGIRRDRSGLFWQRQGFFGSTACQCDRLKDLVPTQAAEAAWLAPAKRHLHKPGSQPRRPSDTA